MINPHTIISEGFQQKSQSDNRLFAVGSKLLMITGRGSAVALASGKKGAFYNTLEEFHKYWERIDIIAPKVKNPVQNIFGNVFIHSSRWPILFHPVFFIRKALEIYKKYKFDLITVHEFPPFYNGIGARMLWNRIKVPYVLEIFHIPGYPKAASLKEKIYRLLFYFFIKYDSKKSKAVRVMNNQVAEKLAGLDVPKQKIKLIPAIYVDLDIFKPMDLEKKYDLIFVGRLVKNKGVVLFLEAVKELDCRALIVGDGPLRENIKLKIKNWKLKIDVYGWAKDQTEVAKLLNQSKILVMPSYNEGGPRVVVEAMACGVPILATPVGIVADIIKNGQYGQIIKWDAEDIAEKAKYILVHQLEYEKHRDLFLEAVDKFEKKSAIKNYAEKLKELSTV